MSSMALTKSFSQMSRADERITRATWGACVAATATTTSQSLGPAMLTSSRAKTIGGKGEDDVDDAHDQAVPPAPVVRRHDAGKGADGHAERGRGGGTMQEQPAAAQDAA